jgi:predicted glycoside hydrolase/deacetylase ChbG (UPF0249 family)
MAGMTTYLLTRGDDLGSFHEANTAIIDSHQNGVLKNAGIMAPAPWFAEAADMARACPGLCLGLHLTLTSEWEQVRWGPLSDRAKVRSLIGEDGNFLADPMQHHQRGVNLDEMMLELKAQLALARRHGLDIQYFDDHMGMSWVHPLREGTRLVDLIKAWAKEEGILWHGDIDEGPGVHGGDRDTMPGLAPTVESVLASCDRTKDRFPLWMTHPAHHGGELEGIDGRRFKLAPGSEARIRDAEARILVDPRFAAGLSARGFKPTTYVEAARVKAGVAPAR